MELQSQEIQVQHPGIKKTENKHLLKTHKEAKNSLKNLSPHLSPHSATSCVSCSLPPFKNFSLQQFLLYSLFLSLLHFPIFQRYWRVSCISNLNPLSFPSAFSLFITPISTTKAQETAFKNRFCSAN